MPAVQSFQTTKSVQSTCSGRFDASLTTMALRPRGLFVVNLVLCFSDISSLRTRAAVDLIGAENPNFTAPLANVTVAVGREAVFECKVDNLSVFKVAWLRVDTQTILTIQSHVITKNHRIAVTHTEHRNWYLHIRDVMSADKGWYMCQINTDPMKSQVGYLNVVVPPDILDYPTSTDMVVSEGSNVSLQCAATGSPQPLITWRREGGELLSTGQDFDAPFLEGPVFNISKVNRLQMGPYLCIASNGVPPSVSKRIMLIVHFPPMIWVQNQLVGAEEDQQVTLECHSEAFPKSISFWTRDDGRIISQGTKYEPIFVDNTYRVHMKLTIRNVGKADFGIYKCVAKNSLGETDGSIKLYEVSSPSTFRPSTRVSTSHSLAETSKSVQKEVKEASGPNDLSHEVRENPGKKKNGSNTEKLERLPPSNSFSPISSAAALDFYHSQIIHKLLLFAGIFVN
ncbi:neurotrimin-like [Euwallacea similis]|uniref:neurotrimin-like n=1 Tax=Euwallacea similis TaxID=1736056 RepID=UPI00344DE024